MQRDGRFLGWIPSTSTNLIVVERDVFLQMFQEDLRNNTVIKSVSFNYTGTLDSIIREIAKEPLNSWSEGGTKTMTMDSDVLHIHGTTSLSPIIGVFDESQIKNKALLSYPGIAQVLIKSTSVQTAGERWYNETAAQINRSRIICIWGMSIGKTDAIWWKHITQWLIQDASRHLIVFWHLSSPPTNRSIIVPFQTKKDVISRLTAFSGLSDADIAAISSRIHIVINTETVLKVAFPKNYAHVICQLDGQGKNESLSILETSTAHLTAILPASFLGAPASIAISTMFWSTIPNRIGHSACELQYL